MNKIIEFNINKSPGKIERFLEIEELLKKGMPISREDAEFFLEKLSYIVRKKIADYEGADMDEYSYYYKCDLAQSMICHYLKGLNISINPVNTNEVINGVCGHSLVTVTFKTTEGEKQYLIDPTYIQFFSKENCDDSKFVIINNQVCISPDPGYFVVKANNINTLMPLLINGFIAFSEDVAKSYGDSFFQTKVGVSPEQIKNNVASGSNYIKWFQHYTSKLSKTVEELDNMGLLIDARDLESVPHL